MNMSTVGVGAEVRTQLPVIQETFCHQGVFWVKPYLQMGPQRSGNMPELVWFTPFSKRHWSVQYTSAETLSGALQSTWKDLSLNRVDKFKVARLEMHQLCANLPALPGKRIAVRVLLNGEIVFTTTILLPDMRKNKCKIVCFGDFADASASGMAIATAVFREAPDLVAIAGDIVYEHGRVSEYRSHFFPVVNADAVNDEIGAPLLRTVLTVAVPGNHCVGAPKQNDEDAAGFDDLFGFFRFFRLPANGPKLETKAVRRMIGKKKSGSALLNRFGAEFIERTTFSFDWCNTHWAFLDANKYMDWTLPELRKWLRDDLMGSAAAWKFVVFHQPGFNSDVKYNVEQRMRVVADILEDCGVDMAFSGHCHFFERHRPIKFRATEGVADDGTVAGELTIDEEFDGVNVTEPDGVIYIITGAGGKLVTGDAKPRQRAETSAVLIDDRESYSRLEVDGLRLVFSQVDTQGNVLDTITITKE